jgi:hypothetical protein
MPHDRVAPQLRPSPVLASIVISTALGLRQSLGLFMQPMVGGPRHLAAELRLCDRAAEPRMGLAQPSSGAPAPIATARRRVVMGTAAEFAIGLALMLFAAHIP